MDVVEVFRRRRRARMSLLQRCYEQLDAQQLKSVPALTVSMLRTQLNELDGERLELDDALDQAFHPFWGSVFKAGGEVSSFGSQVEQYAGIYTSRATNLTQYSPMHYFQSPRHRMPHEV